MPLFSALSALPIALALLDPSYQFSDQTDQNGTAYLVITADEPLKGMTVTIQGDDGTKVKKNVSIGGGKTKKITWKQKGAQVHYTMNLSGGGVDSDFEFDTRKARAGGKASVAMVASREDIVDRHIAKFRTDMVMTNYTFRVYNSEGDVSAEVEKLDADVAAGSTIEIPWKSADEVFIIKFQGEDDVGRSAGYTTVPWSVDIPHETVLFDSGKWNIKGTEEPKVDDAMSAIAHELDGLERAVAALGPDFKGKITASLYVVGYTDTVGNPADNQKLSENRAREIAKAFQDKGIWCAIYYAGMGERGLLVKTDDSVDEVRNRRALYRLAPDPEKPAANAKIPSHWKKLTGHNARMIQTLPELPASYIEHKNAQRAEREKKFGVSSNGGGGDTMGGGGDGGDDEWGKPKGSANSDGGGSDQFVGPEPIDGDDAGSATGKGCSIDANSTPEGLGMVVLLGLLGLRRRRSA